MYRLYKKNELNFSLVWIISYVVLFSVADSFSVSLGTEKIITAPVGIVFTLLLLGFVRKHNLKEKYGLCSFNGSLRNYLYFTPLLLIMSINLWNGVTMKLSVLETVLYILSMLCVGFIEEIIFRGFLFKALYKDNVKLAIVISSVTFWNWTYCKLTKRKRYNTYTLTSLLCNLNRHSFYNYFLQRKEPFAVYYCT